MISAGRAPSPRGAATAGAGSRPKRVVSPVSPRRDLAGGGAGLAPQQHRPASPRGEGVRPVAAAPAAAEPAASSSLPLLDRDPGLRPHEGHLTYRWQRYLDAKAAIAGAKADGESAGGAESESDALAAFAASYRTWGLQRAPGRVTLREWIPGASAVALIGDFNGWQPRDGLDWAQRDAFGVWTLTLPDDDKSGGAPAVAHGSRYKLRVQSAAGGWWADRVSAWARYATAPQGQMGATFDGVAWWPEENERHRWLHPRPSAPIGGGGGNGGSSNNNNGAAALRIYEAHVGMSSEREEVATYAYFAREVLPRVKAQGYNAVQLMAVQEHSYYASFGYHVTSPFAVSSRSGTPEELKQLVDSAHALGLRVLLDVVHSHASKNEADGVAGFDLGGGNGDSGALVRTGPAGYHSQWDSRIYSYEHLETKRYLLSNLRYWIDELGFDGFRFDGVTSMLYNHHGIGVGFSGNYDEYFGMGTDVEACVYLMLANEMTHGLATAAPAAAPSSSSSPFLPPPPPDVLTIAEDVSGMPGLCAPVADGGLGFDARLAMAAPDLWIRLLKHVPDEGWQVSEIVSTLCGRRYGEGRVGTVGYSESHDQAMVGDKTVAMWLFGAEIYEGMSALSPASPVVERGLALHKTISAATCALGGEARMTFMGNEFGHPEWIDFPSEGNGWSHLFARRQWSLGDRADLRYSQLLAWDRALNAADDRHGYVSSALQWVTVIDDARQLIVAERGPLLWVLNFSPHLDHGALRVPAPQPGKYRVVLDSDATCFGGQGRVPWKDYFTTPAVGKGGGGGGGEFYGRGQWLEVASPPRTAVAFVRVREEEVGADSGDGASEALRPPFDERAVGGGKESEEEEEAGGAAAEAAPQKKQRREEEEEEAAPAPAEAAEVVEAAPPAAVAAEPAAAAAPAEGAPPADKEGVEKRGDYVVFRF